MADELVFGLIGCGSMMKGHVRGYGSLWQAGLRGFRVAATCDVDAARAKRFAADIAKFQPSRPSVYTDFRKMLEAEKSLDAVDISLVHCDHHKVAIPCLQAGKHVTIEKPLAITCRAGRAMIDAAQKAGRLLQTAENYRRAPEHRAVNWALRSGRIGELRQLYWIDVGERLWYWSWRDHRDRAGGGWSMDGGVHFADLFRYHVGEVETLYAISRAQSPVRYRKPDELAEPISATVEDTTFAVLEFENAVLGHWTYSGAAPADNFARRAVYGSHGALTWGVGLKTRDEEVSMEQLIAEHGRAMTDSQREEFFPGGLTDTVATELWDFMRAIRGEGTLEVDG
ncbi:MAG: Gfo/Idh/MocA family protein, partial [Planctomycetota bacterium]